MKTVVVRFGGTCTPGDLIILGYRAARGGQSAVKCAVVKRTPIDNADGSRSMQETGAETRDPGIRRAATLEEIVQQFAAEINGGKEFMQTEYSAKAKGPTLIVHCADLGAGVDFFVDVEGAQTETVDLETL